MGTSPLGMRILFHESQARFLLPSWMMLLLNFLQQQHLKRHQKHLKCCTCSAYHGVTHLKLKASLNGFMRFYYLLNHYTFIYHHSFNQFVCKVNQTSILPTPDICELHVWVKGTIHAKSPNIFAYLFGRVIDGLDISSSIYDSIRAIKHVSVMSFSVKTPSTHYQRTVLLTRWLFVYVFIHKQST